LNKLLISLTALLFLSACESGKNEKIVESCFVDGPANGAQLPTNQDFKIVGWAYDKATVTSPEQVSVELSGEETKIFVATRVGRSDVVKAFNTPGSEMSGYEATIPANSLVAGFYDITIWQETPEHKLKCVKSHLIEITGEIKPVTADAKPEPFIASPVNGPAKATENNEKTVKNQKHLLKSQQSE
jgi:hypothetical protein